MHDVERRSVGPFSVNHLDTAQFYGPNIVNELIREALSPYPADLVVVSKVGARRGIAFVPFGSLGFGGSGPDAILRRREVVEEATRLGNTPAQLVLAWALTLAPNVLLIPGASSVDYLRENLAASAVQLDREALDRLSAM
jgi:aryl-alcohol dehydrogenase-like predicted oxidoreductase